MATDQHLPPQHLLPKGPWGCHHLQCRDAYLRGDRVLVSIGLGHTARGRVEVRSYAAPSRVHPPCARFATPLESVQEMMKRRKHVDETPKPWRAVENFYRRLKQLQRPSRDRRIPLVCTVEGLRLVRLGRSITDHSFFWLEGEPEWLDIDEDYIFDLENANVRYAPYVRLSWDKRAIGTPYPRYS